MHNGKIDVHSEVGVGTKFVIELPVTVLSNNASEYANTNTNCNNAYNNAIENVEKEFYDFSF